MRPNPFPFTLALIALALPVAAGQSASHRLTVVIPAILQLRLGDAAGQQLAVPLAIEVEGGAYAITPASSELWVWANTGWQLSASYSPLGPGNVALLARVAGRQQLLLSYPTLLASGGATGGWRPLEIGYALASLPPEGSYAGVITYTLSRP